MKRCGRRLTRSWQCWWQWIRYPTDSDWFGKGGPYGYVVVVDNDKTEIDGRYATGEMGGEMRL